MLLFVGMRESLDFAVALPQLDIMTVNELLRAVPGTIVIRT
jgi:hypothetical protein